MYKYITLGIDEIKKNCWREIKNRKDAINKPLGGLWSSPYTPGEKYLSEWHEFSSDWLTYDTNDAVIFNLIDYEKISKDYDAIELTSRGEIETRFIPSTLESLYGWDVPTLLVLNLNAVKDWKHIKF